MSDTHGCYDGATVLAAFVDANARFVLVGSAAAAVYGASRPVDNIDLLVPRDLEDLARVAGALRTLNARVYVPGLSDADAQALPDVARASFLTNTKLTRWMTDAGPVKVLLEMRDRAGAAHTFEHYARTARAAELFGLPVLVAELDDVLGSNERTQRSHPGIPELRRLVRQAGTSLPGLRSG